MRYRKILTTTFDIKFVMEYDDEEFLYFAVPAVLLFTKKLEDIFEELLKKQEISGPFIFVEDNTIVPEAG